MGRGDPWWPVVSDAVPCDWELCSLVGEVGAAFVPSVADVSMAVLMLSSCTPCCRAPTLQSSVATSASLLWGMGPLLAPPEAERRGLLSVVRARGPPDA